MPNNYYRIYLKDIKNTKSLNYVDLTYEELLSLYNKLLIRKERSEILKERNIKKIVHFTKVENLESIFENGILSVNRLNDSSIAYSPSDPFRLDDKLNMISTSISFPNYKMFYSKRMENTDIDWAVITIDPKLILLRLSRKYTKESEREIMSNRLFGFYEPRLIEFEREYAKTFHRANVDALVKKLEAAR